MKKFIIIFFLLLMVGMVGVGVWYWQKNQWSKEILKLEIVGPTTAQAGDEINYVVRFKNNGDVRLEAPEFSFEFPKNSIPSDNKPLKIIEQLDDIYPDEERSFEFKARLLGRKSEVMEARVSLTYQPKNLKARYENKTSLSTQIEFVPLNFEFDLPSKTESGEKLNFSLNYFSNMNYPLENLRAYVEYPEGFKFSKAKPAALDEKEWKISTLTQADGGRIEINGVLEGEEGGQKIFKAKLGLINNEGEFVLLQEVAQAIKITTATLLVSQTINGSQNYIASAGETLHYELFFKNIGAKPVQNKFLMAKLEGDFFDLSSVKLEKGDMALGDNSIIWDGKTVSALKFLEAGEEGSVEFWVKVKEGERKVKNPVLTNRTSIAGVERVFETKVNSETEIVQRIFYQDEIFGNSGPVRLEPSASTTFTVVWQVKNTWNDLKNAKVKSRLPNNVFPTGKIFPQDAKLTFDAGSKEVIWNIGDVANFQGYDNQAISIAFQISVLPTVEQDLQKLPLIEEANLLAEDAFSGDILQTKANPRDVSKLDDATGGEPQG